ncbi:hypothetical protein BC938DRAFT_480315 [Jimgerdemannia flammicorona]|uniref:YTH domain-containing protein n=1 Tax=Jimgerdemannia flammicorona TaxID=994334 RepID=A0A433QIS3_9FUNG|nr:hypothetical protein BC938DRAFT_480315 [Jimgerdemannia flammicorona]
METEDIFKNIMDDGDDPLDFGDDIDMDDGDFTSQQDDSQQSTITSAIAKKVDEVQVSSLSKDQPLQREPPAPQQQPRDDRPRSQPSSRGRDPLTSKDHSSRQRQDHGDRMDRSNSHHGPGSNSGRHYESHRRGTDNSPALASRRPPADRPPPSPPRRGDRRDPTGPSLRDRERDRAREPPRTTTTKPSSVDTASLPRLPLADQWLPSSRSTSTAPPPKSNRPTSSPPSSKSERPPATAVPDRRDDDIPSRSKRDPLPAQQPPVPPSRRDERSHSTHKDEPNHHPSHHHHHLPTTPPPSSSSAKIRRDLEKERPAVPSESNNPPPTTTRSASRHADALPPQEQMFERQERRTVPSNTSNIANDRPNDRPNDRLNDRPNDRLNDRPNRHRTPEAAERRDRGRSTAALDRDMLPQRTSPSSSASRPSPPSQNNSARQTVMTSAPSSSASAQGPVTPPMDDTRPRRKRSPSTSTSTSTDYRATDGRRPDNKIRRISPSDQPMDAAMSEAQSTTAPPPLPPSPAASSSRAPQPSNRPRQHPQDQVPISLPSRPDTAVGKDRGSSSVEEQQSMALSGAARYFIIKSANFDNVQRSQRDKTECVILIFSVNGSQHFQGYATMTSGVGAVKYDKWTNISESSLGGTFRVRWLKIANLPFERTNNIYNSLNDNKPVKRSRDGQELPSPIGATLCRLFDEVPEGGYPESAATNPQFRSERSPRDMYQTPVVRSRIVDGGGVLDEERAMRVPPRVERSDLLPFCFCFSTSKRSHMH